MVTVPLKGSCCVRFLNVLRSKYLFLLFLLFVDIVVHVDVYFFAGKKLCTFSLPVLSYVFT